MGTRTIALSYDANNRLTSHTDSAGLPRSLNYDARGNVTALGALGFTYDFSDQPRTVLGPATGSYTYDGHLRRVKQVVGGVTRYSVYDAGGGLVAIDQTGVGGGNTEYIRAAGMTLARVVGASVTWLHHDHLGSAVAGTNSAGAVIWRESEQPFGEDWITAPANDNQAGYTGHVEDAATGLTYMQARYYDPVIGRFLSIDPVGFTPAAPAMFNRYAYAANDPVNNWDPDGKYCNSFNTKSEFCARSQRMVDIDSDPIIRSATTFAAVASLTTEELGALDHGSARAVTSPSTRDYLRQLSKTLEVSNMGMFSAIKSGNALTSSDVAKNDEVFVRYEQSIVQGFLDGLKATDQGAYQKLVSESNGTLNSSLGHSDIYNKALDNARTSLGVEKLDFANEKHRVAIGLALTAEVRADSSVVCTGSRIKRESCD